MVRLAVRCPEEYSKDEAGTTNAQANDFQRYKGTIGDLLGSADMAMLLVSGRGGKAI